MATWHRKVEEVLESSLVEVPTCFQRNEESIGIHIFGDFWHFFLVYIVFVRLNIGMAVWSFKKSCESCGYGYDTEIFEDPLWILEVHHGPPWSTRAEAWSWRQVWWTLWNSASWNTALRRWIHFAARDHGTSRTTLQPGQGFRCQTLSDVENLSDISLKHLEAHGKTLKS